MRSCSTTRDPRRDNGSRSVRGRQSANPRTSGGLVMSDQARRSFASPVGIRDPPTGSKRAAIRGAWSACLDLPALGSQMVEAHAAAASISRLPARQVSPGARMQVHPAALPSTSSTQRSQYPRNRTPSPAARRPEAATAAWPANPSGHRLSGRSAIAGGRVRRLDRQHDRCHRMS
jgi:hypothetical protein